LILLSLPRRDQPEAGSKFQMALRPSLFTKGLASGQPSDTGSPAEQRDDAKKNMLKAMRPLPTQHYWNVYFDRYAKRKKSNKDSPHILIDRNRGHVEHRELAFTDNLSGRAKTKRKMAPTKLRLSSLALRLRAYRTSGGITTIHL
jgi:hypothetical protein